MANWSTLKAAVASIINTNGSQAITGQLLQNVLNNIITSVGENCTFAGIATPTTNPGAPDGNVFYLATTAGTYSNFNGIVIEEGEAVILEWNNGAWLKKNSGFATQAHFDKIALSARNRATNLLFCNATITLNTDSRTIHIEFVKTDGISTMFIHHERGFYSTDSSIIKDLPYNSTSLNIIYWDNTNKDIYLSSSLQEVPLDAVIFEVFYTYLGNINVYEWTSPFIAKINMPSHLSAACFFNLSRTETTKESIEEIKRHLKSHLMLKKATSTLFGKIKMVFSNGKVHIKTEITEGYSDMYIYHEGGYISFSTKIDKELSFSGTTYIVFDVHSKDIYIKSSLSEIEKDSILLEAFYSYNGALTRYMWTSPFIEKSGYYYNQEGNFCFQNPKQIETIETDIEAISTILYGGIYSNTYEVKQGDIIELNVMFAEGQKIEVSIESQSVQMCTLGVVYSDGTARDNIVSFYKPSSNGVITAEKNIKKIRVYINSSDATQDLALTAKCNGLLSSVNAESLPRKKATGLFYGSIAMNFSQYKIDVLAKANNTNLNPTYLYHEGGYESVPEIDKTLEWSSNGLVIIYFDTILKDIMIGNKIETIPSSAILLEVFYAYNGYKTFTSWTSTFIPKNGYGIPNSNCCYSNPQQIESLNEKVDEIKLGAIKPLSAKILQRVGCIGDSYTAGYIYTSDGLLNSSPKNAWPHYMESLTGNHYDNWGSSGSTAKGWVLGAANLSQVKKEGNKCQAYIIGLMINDRSSASWNNYYTPVGEKADIGTDNDSYYAYYYKLIQEVVNVNPLAKIFCNTCPKWSETDSYNQAVRDVVSHCKANGQNVYLCDLASAKYSSYYNNEVFANDAINGHYTSIGYEYMAECYLHVLSDVINSNISDFQDIAFIPFDE